MNCHRENPKWEELTMASTDSQQGPDAFSVATMKTWVLPTTTGMEMDPASIEPSDETTAPADDLSTDL